MLEFEARRKKVFEQMKDNSVAILFSGVSKIASADETLPFVANKNFFYLTNIKQEHSILMLIKSLGEKKTYLFAFLGIIFLREKQIYFSKIFKLIDNTGVLFHKTQQCVLRS